MGTRVEINDGKSAETSAASHDRGDLKGHDGGVTMRRHAT